MTTVKREHLLKIHPTPMDDLLSGAKTGEVRRDDRDFCVGDTVHLIECNPQDSEPTGRELLRTISHIQRGYGLPDGLCVLSYAQASAAPEQEPFGYMRPEGVELVQRGDYGSVHHKVDGYHTIPVFTHADPSEVERLRAALQHIIKAVGQSRSSTRRLRWIEQRAVWALEGREYDNSQFDLPKNAGNTAERATQEAARLRAENKRLDLALAQADHNYDCDRQQFEQKLAEAQALLRDVQENGETNENFARIGNFLSATAQPAEVKS